jgi:hypothetical protein
MTEAIHSGGASVVFTCDDCGAAVGTHGSLPADWTLVIGPVRTDHLCRRCDSKERYGELVEPERWPLIARELEAAGFRDEAELVRDLTETFGDDEDDAACSRGGSYPETTTAC